MEKYKYTLLLSDYLTYLNKKDPNGIKKRLVRRAISNNLDSKINNSQKASVGNLLLLFLLGIRL